jgi:hypothetical protein
MARNLLGKPFGLIGGTMKKLFFIFAIAITLFGCSDNSSSPQICEKKKLYPEDVLGTRYKDYYYQVMENACDHWAYGDGRENDVCAHYNKEYYITIEECGDIYIKE